MRVDISLHEFPPKTWSTSGNSRQTGARIGSSDTLLSTSQYCGSRTV